MTWEELKTHKLVIYSTTWCPDCHRLKQRLDEQKLRYDEIDIDADPKAAKHLQKQTGRAAIPYVEIDGKCMIRGWHQDTPGRWDETVFLQEAAAGLEG